MHTTDRRFPAPRSAGQQGPPPPSAAPQSGQPLHEERLGPRLEPRTRRRRRRRDTAAITAFVRGLNATSGEGGVSA